MPAKEKAKNKTKELEKKLKLQGKLVWDRLEEKERKEVFRFAEGYKAFLDRAKTEREAVREILQAAEKERIPRNFPERREEKNSSV